jgi:hypothetical protein
VLCNAFAQHHAPRCQHSAPLPPDFRANFNREENNPALHYVANARAPTMIGLAIESLTDGYLVGRDSEKHVRRNY